MSLSPLTNLDLYTVLAGHKGIPFGGVYFRNTLPQKKQTPTFYIVNTAKDTHPTGLHWVALYVGIPVPEYFDSLGRKPHPDLVEFLGPRYAYCKHSLQDPTLPTCGYYVLFYIIQRAKGFAFHQIVQDIHANNICSIVNAITTV